MTLTCWEKLSLIALIAIGLRILLRISILVWRKIVGPRFGLGIDLTSQGRWAVVTGCTSGIGKAFAEQLAQKGLDVVLVSRSLRKLQQLEAEMKERYGIQVRIVEADLTEGQAAYTKIAKATQELEIAIAVNNAGASYEHPELFTEISEECVANILQLNVAAVTGIARIFLPKMFERKKGVLLNVSSALAVIPAPYLALYAASKAYIAKLSYDLATEAEPHGVTVHCLLPALVATKMSKIKKATWVAPTAEKFVESALKTIGMETMTTGFLPHELLVGIVHGLRCVCEKAALWLILKTTCNIRRRALNKKVRKTKDDAKENLRHDSPITTE